MMKSILFSAENVYYTIKHGCRDVKKKMRHQLKWHDGVEAFAVAKWGYVMCETEEGMRDAPDLPIWRLFPYGKVGDLLWVREPFDDLRQYPDREDEYKNLIALYKADCVKPYGRWMPGSFMPRVCSRLIIRIEDVHVAIGEDYWSWDIHYDLVANYGAKMD